MAICAHCGSEIGPASDALSDARGPDFCCKGCQGAYALVRGLGLDGYYKRRSIDPSARPLRPEDEAAAIDYAPHVKISEDGTETLHLMVEGMHCAACVWLIESLLAKQPGVVEARLNMTTRRLVIRWRQGENDANAVIAPVMSIGYHLLPYDPARLGRDAEQQEKTLLRSMAVAGFAAGNVMLFSVSIWSGESSMDWTTRSLFHWLSALIALPAVLYCIRPFARSAFTALRAGRTNMDVPITLGVFLACSMSLWETMHGGHHAYFDAAVSLLFFLLIGRYLDSRARGRARSAAEHLLSLGATAVTVLEEDGTRRLLPPEQVTVGMTVLLSPGDRVGVDGTVTEGLSEIDTSLITGETVPAEVKPGSELFAGTLNLSGALRMLVTAVGEKTLLSEIVRMMEVAEQGRAKYVAVADRVARYYAPVVHIMGLSTFLGWEIFTDTPWQLALLYAVSVLIITCPCALALAVPVVQVVASGRLLRQGILLKSATAQERLAQIDTVVFDKTGTLTVGRPELIEDGGWSPEDLHLAASIAAASKHPVARAICRALPGVALAEGVREVPGCGLEWGEIKLGGRRWLELPDDGQEATGPELFLARPGQAVVRFAFSDLPRSDAAEVVAWLKKRGYRIELLSGDRQSTVASVAAMLGISDWRAGCTPSDKCARLAELEAEGRKVLMVGDGLNDAPALASAHVSMSPSSAVDVSQTVADIVFQGHRLTPVVEALEVSCKAGTLVKQNFGLALGYNLFTIPMAVMGMVTPLIASIAMSTSSVIVIANALRLARRRVR